MAKEDKNESNFQHYGFEGEDIFPGANKNVDKPIDYLIPNDDSEDEHQTNEEIGSIESSDNEIKPLLSEKDLFDVVDKVFRSKYSSTSEANKPISNLIKKENSSQKNVMDPTEFRNNLSRNFSITDSEWSEIADEFENSDILNDDFLDFIELPRISGDEKNMLGKNLISGEFIHSSNKRVEISDNHSEEENEHSTSIEINRSENGDIESISVYCKCGEITNIRFDYEDEGRTPIRDEFLNITGSLDTLKLNEIRTQKS